MAMLKSFNICEDVEEMVFDVMYHTLLDKDISTL